MLGRIVSTGRRWLALTAVFCLVGAPAHAKWHEAQSDNFVIYANDSAKDIQRFAEDLERYHSAMELLTGREIAKPSPSNRVTIYVVGTERQLGKLAGSDSVAGFYVPRAGGSVAFVQDIRVRSGNAHFSTIVLLHEYAHHFLISTSRYAMPRWLSEGAAEFFASAAFPKDGGIIVGQPAHHRSSELFYSDDVPLEELFDHNLYRENRRKLYDSFYGRSWLLYHYLMFSEERRGQLVDYGVKTAAGTPSLDAAREVFGDLEVLEGELDAHLKIGKFRTVPIGPSELSLGTIEIRELSKGHAKAMPLIIQSKRGVTREEAEKLAPKFRKVARSFPQDPAVLAALAEAEYDAGQYDAAISAADRAVAIDPSQKNAYIQKGYALFAKAEDAEDEDAAFKAAMAPFTKLNRLENDHPLPLVYYFRSYAQRGMDPPENAKHALERASQLAPFDHSLALNVATMQAREGKVGLAQMTLAPVAANPHGGAMAEVAEELMDQMAEAPEGEPFTPRFAEEDSSDKGETSAATDGDPETGGGAAAPAESDDA